MKRVVGFMGAALIALASALSVSAGTILLNEIEVNPSVDVGDRCQYVELKGTPGATIPVGYWFLSINYDQSNFGFVNASVPLEGQTFGSNGLVVLDNINGGDCPNRTLDANANVIEYYHWLSLGKGAEGYYIVFSDTLNVLTGTDLDTDDNGLIDALEPLKAKSRLGATALQFIDGIDFNYNPDELWDYGPGPNLVENFLGGVPSAATRFPDNDTPMSAAAWYSGTLAASPEETVEYSGELSSNAPSGAKLTPGAPNFAGAVSNAYFDFDGDGKTDVSMFRPNPSAFAPNRGPEGSSAQWWIYNSSDMSTFAAAFGSPSDIPVPADYTGDGKTDIAFYRSSTSEWFVLRSEDQSYFAFTYGSSGDRPAPADYDGDGIADPAVYRPSNGTWFVLQSSDSQTQAVPFGITEDLPTVGDFDGDGKSDFAVFRPSVSQWWQLRSTEGVKAFEFGQNGDETVIGDYTGDGKADVAFYRPSTSEWYVLRSEDDSYFAFTWGAVGDIATPGDYDGDGQTDPAVFRPSDNTWYILGSTSGFQAVPFGTTGDVPIPNVPSQTAP